jgi:hypothetical protein
MFAFVANKKLIVIITVVAVATLFGGLAIAELAQNPETAKDVDNERGTNQTKPSFYEQAYAKATSEQKAELDKIIADKSIGLPGEWRRPVLITTGDLPKDQPRLTAKQAGEIYDRIGGDEGTLLNEFDKIAGEPDFIGGCGIVRYIYYLNDDRSEAIVYDFNAHHVIFNANGTQTTLPIGNQQLHVEPRPSTSPGTPQTRPQPTLTDIPIPSPT